MTSKIILTALLTLGGTSLAYAGPDSNSATEPGSEETRSAATPAAESAPAATSAQTPATSPGGASHAKHSGTAAQLGQSPDATRVAGPKMPSAAPEPTSEDWGFKFHGFFRGPMRLSFSDRKGEGLQFRAPPNTPDSNYTLWKYTNNNPGPWAELMFQYGNNRTTMTAAIASYNITSGGWRELQDQLGIDRAFLTMNFPEAFGDYGKLVLNAGVFSNRYGGMGKYDAGAYETYVIGQTRAAGETLTGEFDIGDDAKLVVEGGTGAKMDTMPWTGRSISLNGAVPYASWEPYPGFAQQGTTLLAHLHAGLIYNNSLTITAHGLYTWTADSLRTDTNLQKENRRDGSMRVLGLDAKLDGGWMGDGYLGLSRIDTKNVGVLSDTIEVIHSQGGWQFANNFVGNKGDGTVTTIAGQYSFSVAGFLLRPQPWWGNGTDLTFQIFGMYNHISGADPVFTGVNGTNKLKVGGQFLYTPLPYMSVGMRYDLVQPNMDDKAQSFVVYSPRLVFRTEFVTHEQIIVQYQRYAYNSAADRSLPFPYGTNGAPFPVTQADKNAITVAASMWW